MSQPYICPHCNGLLAWQFLAANAGRAVACPHCQRQLEIPALAVARPAVEQPTRRADSPSIRPPPATAPGARSAASTWFLTIAVFVVGAFALYSHSEQQRLAEELLYFRRMLVANERFAEALGSSAQGKQLVVDELRAKVIQIVNSDGRVVALLDGFGEGANLALRARDGTECVSLTAGEKGGICTLNGGGLFVEGKDSSAVVMEGALLIHGNGTNKSRVCVGLQPDTRGGFVEINNQLGRSVVSVQCNEKNNGGGVYVSNQFGKEVASLQSNKNNSGGVYLRDTDGQIRKLLAAP